MKKTKLVPITSLDQLEVGIILINDEREKIKVLGKCGVVVFVSQIDDFFRAASGGMTLEELTTELYQLEVTEEPWRPKDGESYYYPNISEGKPKIDETTWLASNRGDNSRLKAGLVCKTKQEALAKAQKMLDFIKDSE